MTALLSALADVGPSEDQQAQGLYTGPSPYLPELKNYAEDDDFARATVNLIMPILSWSRSYRQTLEEEWRQSIRMEMLQHDHGRRFFGNSNVYVPMYAKIKQTLVSSLSQGLFPSDEYMDVVDRDTGRPDRAKPTKTYVQWDFDQNAKIRREMKRFLGSLVNYGTSVMKGVYKRDIKTQGRAARGFQPRYGPTPTYEGLCTTTRNLLSWYVYPVTADRLEDATLIFEDVEVPKLDIELLMRRKVFVNDPKILTASPPPEYMEKKEELLGALSGMAPPTFSNDPHDPKDIRVLTEVWTYLKLPRSAYLDHEDPNDPLPARVVLAGSTPALITRNPYFHQRPPYVVSRMNANTGLFYGYGAGKVARPLQLLANDFANQTNDCGTWTLNPLVKVNPGFIAGPLQPMAPGVTWLTTDVDQGMKFDRPPVELIQYGLQMFNTWMSMGQDLSGAPPVLQGTGARGAAKTATGAQILQRNAVGPLQDVVEDIELESLVDLMYFSWVYAQQFRNEDVMAMVAGESIKVSLEELVINPEFRWLASSQAINQAQRAQQTVGLLQVVQPLIPYINQLGYVVDPVPVLQKLYSDGMGYRGFDRFIRPAQGANAAGLGMPSANNMNAASQEQGDRVRSALEQLGGGVQSAAPGEGEDFMDVRAQADAMAAQMGGLQ